MGVEDVCMEEHCHGAQEGITLFIEGISRIQIKEEKEKSIGN